MTEIPTISKIGTEMKQASPPSAETPDNQPNGFSETFITILIALLFVALIATYFVVFDVEAEIDIKRITVNTVWFAVGTFSIATLGKRLFREKGKKSDEYKTAARDANAAIEKLCESEYADRAADYCKQYTIDAIKRYREHQLTVVGIKYEEYEEKYLSLGFFALLDKWLKKELTFEAFCALRRCNTVKMKPYNPNFILSYNSAVNADTTPSAMFNVEGADLWNNVSSAFATIFSAIFVGSLLTDVFFNWSAEVFFEAVVKIVMLAINFVFKAIFGWNLSLMETQRNKLRASEAQACMDWAKRNPKKLEENANEEDKGVSSQPVGAAEG